MNQRRIFVFWLPLFASWMLMTSEGPLLSAVINRLPNEVVMLAALGIVFSIAVTIESPIINLLSTSTALVRDRPSYVVGRRFTVHWMLIMAAIGVWISYGSLFEIVVIDLLGTPLEVASWVRPGLKILILWPPAIAWRRYHQGILIRWGLTRTIARGTALRLAATAGTGFGLAFASTLPGIHIATSALLAGAMVEAVYAWWVALPVLREMPSEAVRPLSYGQLLRFHMPLAGTSLLILSAQPMVSFTLARLADPEVNLAAWPLVFQTTLALRAAALALPEVVIALSEEEGAEPALRQFSLRLAGVALVGMAFIVLTPLLSFYLLDLQDTVARVADIAGTGLLLCLPLPAIEVIVAWLQGTLIARGRTQAVNAGTAIRLAVLAVGLGIGLHLGSPSLSTAVIALQASVIAQGLYFYRQTRSI